MTHPISTIEVEEALWSLGEDKALGLNWFLSHFFAVTRLLSGER